jgi:hypothetical protein
MSVNWNPDQLVSLSSSLSDAFAGAFSAGQVRQVKQPAWTLKSLIRIIHTKLQGLSKFLLQGFRSRHSHPAQTPKDEWTTEALIRMSEAKASAFFCDR